MIVDISAMRKLRIALAAGGWCQAELSDAVGSTTALLRQHSDAEEGPNIFKIPTKLGHQADVLLTRDRWRFIG
jgi:hypothetical protein